MTDHIDQNAQNVDYSRRDALRALARYSAVVGSASTVIVSAEGLVSAASAYACPPSSNAPHCSGPGSGPGNNGNGFGIGSGQGNANGRNRF